MPPKLNQQQAEERIKNYNSEYELISKYENQNTIVTLRHSCGHEYSTKFKLFLEGSNQCPKCKTVIKGKSTKKITEQTLIDRVKEQLGSEYSYISGFTTMDKKCTFHHNDKDCDKDFEASPKMILGVKQRRCPYCANKNRGSYLRSTKYLDNLLKKATDGKEYKWLGEYNYNNKEKIKIKHLSCNREYFVRPNDFQQGYRCPYCAEEAKESKGVSRIKEILNENNIEFKTEVTFDDLINIDNLRIDFSISNTLIEYDGSQHFSEKLAFSEESYKYTKIRDLKKNNWVKENNYKFIRIPFTVKLDDLNFIILSIVFNTLNEEIINKYNLYVYEPNNKVIYNEMSYYTDINVDYFNENIVEPS